MHLTPDSWDAEVCRLEISGYCYPPVISDLERELKERDAPTSHCVKKEHKVPWSRDSWG